MRRRSVRLPDHDYAGGLYFATICTHGHASLFGEVIEDAVRLSAFGRVVEAEWRRTFALRREAVLDAFVVMPNHVHVLVGLVPPLVAPNSRSSTPPDADPPAPPDAATPVGAHGRAPLRPPMYRPPRSLGSLVAGFKSASTRRINALRGTPGAPVWQRNYHEHVVRGDRSAERIRRYIQENPLRWHLDRYHPDRLPYR